MSVEVTTLPTGLRIVTDAMAHLKTASIGVIVGAGSRHESAGEHGLSHLLEHMAFKGTRRRSARDIAEEIENAGGDLNAETGVEQTGYFARVLGADVDLAVDILGDILTQSQFDAAELEREKGVILQEISAVDDTPDDLIFDLFSAAAWPGQPIGRAILGTPEGVSGFDRQVIDGYLRRHYHANAIIISAAGAVEHNRIVDLAARKFEGLGKSKAPPPLRASYSGGQILVKKPIGQTHIAVGFEGRATGAADHDAAHVFAAAVGGGMSSRLFQEVREKRGLAYAIYAFHWAFSDTGLFGFYAAASPRDVSDLMAASLDCLHEASRQLNDGEIRRAKAQLKVSLLSALESPAARAQQIARHLIVYGRVVSFEDMLARIDAISAEDTRRVGSDMLLTNHTLAAIGRVGKVLDQGRIAQRLGGS